MTPPRPPYSGFDDPAVGFFAAMPAAVGLWQRVLCPAVHCLNVVVVSAWYFCFGDGQKGLLGSKESQPSCTL